MKVLQGIQGAPGLARGKAVWAEPRQIEVKTRSIDPEQVEVEIERYRRAVDEALEELAALEKELARTAGNEKADIIAAQGLMISDPVISGEVEEMIRIGHLGVESAVAAVFARQADLVGSLPDEYLAARALDLKDVAQRLLGLLTGAGDRRIAVTEPSVLLAYDLTPSQTAELDPKLVKGLVLVEGGPTSHTAILARSLGIPAVLAVGPELKEISSDDDILVDGEEGLVIIGPDRQQNAEFEQKLRQTCLENRELQYYAALPTETSDGNKVEVVANIGSPADTKAALDAGAVGVGLYRTEFIFLERTDAPGEEEQYRAYREVIEQFAPNRVILRTLDIGGDKQVPYLNLPHEPNPFLGVRGIRLCFQHPQLFNTQLRAICRASAHGKAGVMFPMICTVNELKRARAQVIEVQAALKAEGLRYDPDMEIGIMIETPAAALIADQLAPFCSFFSLGTNDLLQYTMATDRLSQDLLYLYQPQNISLIRLIDLTVKAAREAGIGVSICGEIAGDPKLVPLLLGLGLDKFSVAASQITRVKKAVRETAAEKAAALAREALKGK